MLPFLVASIIFALIGTGVRGIIRPISWATLAIATLVAGYGGLPNLFTATIAPASNSTLPSPGSTSSSPTTTTSPITAAPPQPSPGQTGTAQNGANTARTGLFATTPRIDPAFSTLGPANPPISSVPGSSATNPVPPRVSQSPAPGSTATNTVPPNDRVVRNPQTGGAVTGLW